MPRASRVSDPLASYYSAPTGWDSAWRAALAASSTTPAVISFIGSSFAQGLVASDYLSLGYAGRLISSLKASYGARGDFYCTTESQHWLNANGGTYTWGGTAPWTLTGTVTYFVGYGYTKTPFWSASATTNLATFVTPYACTAIDFLHYDHTAGTFEYRVDGGSATTVTNTASGVRKRISLTGLSNATHTVTFGNTSVLNALGLIGAATYAGTTGIAAARLGVAYGLASNLTTGIAGNGPNTAGTTTTYHGLAGFPGPLSSSNTFGFPAGAHLAVIDHGANDASSPTALVDNLGLLIAGVRRAMPGASILLVGAPYPSAVSDVVPTVTVANYAQTLGAIAQVAQSYGAAFASVHARWGSTPFAQGFTSATNQHPTTAGQADIAAALSPLIL